MRKTSISLRKKKEPVDESLLAVYGLKYKDHLGNPWFLPTDEGGIVMNYRCCSSAEEFMNSFRLYMDYNKKK